MKIFILGALLLAACSSKGSSEGEEGGRCHLDHTCDDDLVCTGNVCRAPDLPDSRVPPDARLLDAPPSFDAPPHPDAAPHPDAKGAPDAGSAPDAPPGVQLDAPVTASGPIRAAWVIRIDGALASCADVGGDAVRITSTRGGASVADLFDCTSGQGTTNALPAGDYAVRVTLLDAQSQILSEVTASAHVVAGQTDDLGTVTFAFTTSGKLSASWRLFIDGGEVTCAEAGGNTVELESTSLATGQHSIDDFDCADGAGTTATFDPGSYQVVARLFDGDGQLLSDGDLGTFQVSAGTTTGLGEIDFDIPADGGRFGLTWEILLDSHQVDCATVGAKLVELDEIPVGGGQTFADVYDCEDFAGVTDLLPPDAYHLDVLLLDAAENPITFIAPEGSFLVASGQTTDAGHYIFDLVSKDLRLRTSVERRDRPKAIVRRRPAR